MTRQSASVDHAKQVVWRYVRMEIFLIAIMSAVFSMAVDLACKALGAHEWVKSLDYILPALALLFLLWMYSGWLANRIAPPTG